jgi:hypothetical protein
MARYIGPLLIVSAEIALLAIVIGIAIQRMDGLT